MPPYKAGLLKRKVDSNKSDKNSTDDKESGSSNEAENLIEGELDAQDDATDSEHEAAAASDGEVDEVVFDDSAVSLLEDEQQSDQSLDESSDLTDSEENDSDIEDASSEASDSNNRISDNQEEDDSGAETGTAPSAGSSDESSKKPQDKAKTQSPKPKPTPKQKAQQVDKKQKRKVDKKQKKLSSVDVLANKIKETKVATEPVQQRDEYESGDTSDEEDRVNTVGEVPMWWYNEYPHVGYDLDGRRLIKPPQRDHIDDFLKKCEDPEFWRTVRDPATGQDVVLSKEDLQLLERIRTSRVPTADHDEYEPWVEWFSREVLATPLRAFPEHKRSFLPSRSEQLQVAKIVHALKMGWTKTRKQIADERRRKRERNFYNLWGSSDQAESSRPGPRHLPAPRRPLPSHAESYNPPPEYLLDHKEMKEWDKLAETPWKRKYTFLPTAHSCLRAVPAYPRFVRERFLRCLDLYLAPRAIKMRLTISAEDLVPKLPSPRDLQPFPTAEVQCLRGHGALVRSVDFDPSGQYVVSASDDGTIKVWETSTGRCLRTVELGEAVTAAAWTPVAGLSLVAVALGRRLLLLNPGADIGAARVARRTDELLQDEPSQHDATMDERTSSCVQWQRADAAQWARGVRLALAHFRPLTHVSWHAKGDYLCATLADAASRAVVVHQLSRRRSQLPFRRAKGLVQCALFHPHRPQLLVATQRVVRVYDLLKQELVRKLQTGAQWISALAVHPAGDNLLVSSYDRKLIWFDLELSSRPYQTLRLHGRAVRALAFHRRYPLFASAGDDPYLVVSHGMVYNDLLQNPLLVPLKQLAGPERRGELCVLGLRWHPAQPWLLAAAADHTLRLYA
ncbi:ribosome biogenesis protein BOP1 homolog isoform X1 [Maniola jurtina]|uniref:ribosome biogenesis protein BOP1 homolog isoform X1 n=1 Tax=Maniola jurtina TaxID=191418 RepID=UPI001E688A91|nr:ribosome biogenesis protein BOP1 homolog isoform X1 [Maniola jurtina]